MPPTLSHASQLGCSDLFLLTEFDIERRFYAIQRHLQCLFCFLFVCFFSVDRRTISTKIIEIFDCEKTQLHEIRFLKRELSLPINFFLFILPPIEDLTNRPKEVFVKLKFIRTTRKRKTRLSSFLVRLNLVTPRPLGPNIRPYLKAEKKIARGMKKRPCDHACLYVLRIKWMGKIKFLRILKTLHSYPDNERTILVSC